MGTWTRRGTAVAIAGMLVPSILVSGASEVAAAAPPVVINELHYNPADDNPASEFIELLNTTDATVSLAGWCIDGVSYCFPGSARIGARSFLVVRGSVYSGALSNGGEDIALLNRSGAQIDFVEYDDKQEWPSLADGEGFSLQRRSHVSESDHPGNWVGAPPTPGAVNSLRGPGLLPVFSDVEHTELPAPGAAIRVTADLDGATSATLEYRVGLGGPVVIPMSVSGGVAAANIPGQSAGQLVRYRLRATSAGLVGTWPRQGDGSSYRGTTVRRPGTSQLPTFEIFMRDAEYNTMINDLTLHGDDGYPMVLAFKGQVFDRARIRVKGQVSRNFPKKKLKIILPAGYDIEDDLFPDDIDEFAIHSSWTDKSFLRETLASEFMTAAGAPAQQAFPIRVERNGAFYGLYTYVEQPDGTYRGRFGYDDSEVYEVGPDNLFGLLSPQDPGRSQAALRARYDKETFEYLDDGRLRNFIGTVNALRGVSERNWLYNNADVPSMVNALAGSMVMQHQDWGHKNYRIIFNEYGRVSIAQNDFDLSFGRRYSLTFGALDERVYVGGAFEHPGAPLFETFYFDAELAAMVKRRIRTLIEEEFEPNKMRARVTHLAAQVRPDAVADRARWGTYKSSADPGAEANRIIDSFVIPQRNRLLGSFANSGRIARNSQPAIPNVSITTVFYDDPEHVVITNSSGDTVDISGFEIPELDFVVPGGTVLLAGRSAVFAHEDISTLRNQFPGLLVAGVFGESLNDSRDGITLRNRAGAVVSARTILPPRQFTKIKADANKSALISVVATETGANGFVQVLDCDAKPGKTANLNADGPGQTRSGLALAKFDGDGELCIYNASPTHIVSDLQGYFADGAVDDVTDERLVDTRKTPGKPARGSITRISGRPNSTAIVNLVATQTAQPGFLRYVPCDTKKGTTSNLNYPGGNATIASLSFATFNAAGNACIFTSATTHVIADLQGYVNPGSFDDVADDRLLDTRSGGRPGTQTKVVVKGAPNSTAVVSVAATETAGQGFLQLLPCPARPGATANLNYDRAFQTVNGLSTLQFNAAGEACIFVRTAAHVVVDLQGYFTPGAFDDVTDRRLADTRKD